MRGKVYLVGAGPGERDLITLKGLEILRQADVVIYDYLVDKRILDYAKGDAELICCDILDKERYCNGFVEHSEKITRLMIKKIREGKKVIRLKNGDPAVFSRLSQELEALTKAKIEFEIVPGVTAASGASAFSGIPLTDRRFASSCIFVTGHEDNKKRENLLDWQVVARQGTIVIYMGIENLERIVKNLIGAGKSFNTPVAIIHNASLLTQKILIGNLKNIVIKAKRQRIRAPSIIIIGDVVRLEKRFNWLKKTKKVLFTGLSKERFYTKGRYFYLPLIKIEALDDYTDLDRNIAYIKDFDWIVFSSRYGVEYFFKRLFKLGYDTRILNGIKIGAVGTSTKDRLLDFGVVADLVPKEESSKGLLGEFKKIPLRDKKILLPRSDIADKGLADGLRLEGARVVSCMAYKNVMPVGLPDLDWSFFDEIMFTSPSTIRNFIKRYGRPPEDIKVSCIGDVTLREAKRWNLLD